MVNEWRTDEPPKTGTFLADVGLPWPVVAVWNAPSEQYVYADLHCDLYHGQWNDFYFENEYFGTVYRWAPMPTLPPRDNIRTET